MEPAEIRRIVVAAVFSDNTLMEKFVLKGGTALEVVHEVVTRGSVDVDLSIQGDFDDIADVETRLLRSLKDRFDAEGMHVFDFKFREVPLPGTPNVPAWWGGYVVEFKVISRKKRDALEGNLEKIRIQSDVIDTLQNRKFSVQISKHEFCEGKEQKDLEGYTVFVYSLPMCVAEKLRAICQQMPEYVYTGHPCPRARDFYDIHSIITKRDVDLSSEECAELMRSVFAAKQVPLALLQRIGLEETREFHRPDWENVRDQIPGKSEEFEFYFDSVAQEVKKLEHLWKE